MNQDGPHVIVAIYLRGEYLQPQHISEIIGVKPSRSQVKGGLSYSSKSVTAKLGVWVLIAKTESSVLGEHIEELLNKVSQVQNPFDNIEGVEEAYLDIYFPLGNQDDASEKVAFVLTKQQIAILNKLGLSIQFETS